MTMVKRHWSVAEAKAQLSTVLRQAEHEPQVVESRGRPVAVVVGVEEFARVGDPVAGTLRATRWQRFLELSETVRSEGGGSVRTTKRAARPSPFDQR